MNNKIPRYFYEVNNIVSFLTFTLLFSLLFINIYSPFGLAKWITEDKTSNFFISTLIVFSAFGVLVFSRALFYQVCRKLPLAFWQYFVWIFGEILAIAVLYSTFSKVVLLDEKSFTMLLSNAALFIFLILLIPYTLSFLYFNLVEKKKKLKKFRERNKKVMEKSILDIDSKGSDLIHFRDENQTLRLTIVIDKLLYIESFVNYVIIYYEQNNEILSYQLRSSLKNIENQELSPQLVRCHRSFMVNFSKIAIFKKEKEGTFLQFEQSEIPEILVSKTYLDNITQKFKNNINEI